MKKKNLILMVLLAASLGWATNSFTAVYTEHIVNVEGLTLDEAREKYGVDSGVKHPVIFEVNGQSGPRHCRPILASGGAQACPTAKIFYQSTQVIPNYDGTSTMKVDIYYDINNEVIVKKN